MKTWQMIKELTENPEKKFRHDNHGYVCVERGIVVWRGGINKGQRMAVGLIDERDSEWEEVKEPLTFIELLKSIKNNKTISVENKTHGISYRRFYLNDILAYLINEFPSTVIAEILLDSEFYIED